MRVTIIVGEFYPVNGGVSNAVFGFCKALIQAGHKVFVITPKISKSKSFENYSEINIIRIKCSNFVSFMIKSILKIKITKPDVILGEMIWTGGTISGIAGKLFNITSITHAHGADLSEIYKFYQKFFTYVSLKLNDKIFSTNSEHSEEIQKYCKKRIFILPNVLYLNNDEIIKTSKQKCREILGFDNKKFNILSIGRMVKVNGIETKGISYAIKSISYIDNCCLHILGDGPLKHEYQELIKEKGLLGKVKLYGKVNRKEMFMFMKASDALVFPSLYEGLSMVMIESLALKLPIITTNIGGARDFIVNNQNGLLIEKKDTKSIIKAIEILKLNKQMREMISKNAFQTYLENFTPKSVIKKFETYVRE